MTRGLRIETERLLLRDKTPDDVGFMHRLLSDPAVMRYVGEGRPRGLEEVRAGLEKHIAHQQAHGFSLWLVLERAAGEPIGDCGLMHLEEGPEVEVGYRFVPEAWGRGYATEAAEASLAYGFDVLGLDEIVAVAYPDNAASRRVMEKIGMRYDGRGMYYGNDSVRYVTGRTPTGPVEIVTYDPAWPSRFEEERARIAEALGSRAPVIEHIGSTAVPGLAAKPVIDVLLGVRSHPLDEAGVRALETIGYDYRGEFGIPGRQFFRKGEPRSHHVHAVELGSDLWVSNLVFRDRLRDHPEEAARYASLKRELASRYADERGRYTEAKAPFIEELLQRAAPR